MPMPPLLPVPAAAKSREGHAAPRPAHRATACSLRRWVACAALAIATNGTVATATAATSEVPATSGTPATSVATNRPDEAVPALRYHDHALVNRQWDVQQQRFVDRDEVLARVLAADVVLLGETHDNPVHHRLQGEILATLLAAGRRPTLVMEQFDTEQQGALDAATDAAAVSALMARGWDSGQYRPLIESARQAGLPLVAGNVSRADTRPVIREGWQAIDPPRRERLQLDPVWDGRRETYMRQVITASHCGKIDDTLRDGLVRAQRLRDAVLADVALAPRPAAADGSTVFIVGRGHARSDVGVPRYLRARSTSLTVLSVGFTEVSPDKTAPADYLIEDGIAAPGAPHDLLWFTPRQTRPDPCKDFGKR